MKSTTKIDKERAAKAASGQADETVAEVEEVRPAEAPQVTGKKLIALIRQRLADLRMPERAICDVIGVTPIYWNSLTNGHRRIGGLPIEKMRRLAEFLELPVFHAYMLAETYKASDLVVTKRLDDDLRASLAKMRMDKRWSFLVPDDETLELTPQAAQLAIVMLYEHVAANALQGRALMEAGVAPGGDQDPNFALTV